MAGAISNDYINMINKKGSGYNIPVIVDAIVKSEIDPAKSNVTARKLIADAAISGMASLKSSARLTQTAVNGLSSLNDYNLSTSTTGTLTMTTDDGDSLGSFSKDIANVLVAKAQILSINNFDASAVGAAFVQQLSIVVGPDALGASVTSPINIIATDTVASIAARINNIAGLKGEVIDTGIGLTPLRIVITGDLGTVGNYTIATNLAGGGKMSTTPHADNTPVQAHRNASFTLDGVAISRSTNTISDLLGGVTINLLKDDAAITKVTSSLSADKVQATVEKLVAELNLYKQDMDVLGFMDSKNNANGDLAQNAYLRSAQREFNRLITSPIMGYTVNGAAGPDVKIHFVDFGIKTTKSGQLEFDQKIFNQTFTREPEKFDALTLDVAYSSDPNVKVFATPTSTMPTGEHQFTNHVRQNPSASSSIFSGFRSLDDVLVPNSAISFSAVVESGVDFAGGPIHTAAFPPDTVRSFVARLNALAGLNASARTDTNGDVHIDFSINQFQPTVDHRVNQLDLGDRLTVTGSLSNAVTGVAQIHKYEGFTGPTEVIPAQTFPIVVAGVNRSFTINRGTVTNVVDQMNTALAPYAVTVALAHSGTAIKLTAANPGVAHGFTTPTINRGSGHAHEVVVRAPVTQVNNSIGGINNLNNAVNESWADVVDVGNFSRADNNGNNSTIGNTANGATYSSPSFTGFLFVTNSNQVDCKLYVGRSVKTLTNNFFNDALEASAIHHKVSDLYTGRSNSLANRLTQIDEREAALRTKYTSQFAAMETIVTGGSSTSEFLESMVAAWRKP